MNVTQALMWIRQAMRDAVGACKRTKEMIRAAVARLHWLIIERRVCEQAFSAGVQ